MCGLAACLFSVLVILHAVCAGQDDQEGGYQVAVNRTLYYGTQGWRSGSRVYPPGLYSGRIESTATSSSGNEVNLTSSHLTCFLIAPLLIREDKLYTRGIAYDVHSDKVLYHMYDERRTSVFVLPRCVREGDEMCSYNVVKHDEDLQARAVLSYGTTSDRDDDCPTLLQPFSMYKGDIYFVARRIMKNSSGEKMLRLELRQMGCTHDSFHSQHPFNLARCSELIILLDETTPDRCNHVTPGHYLLIVPDPNVDPTIQDKLRPPKPLFFLQVFNQTDSHFSISLILASKELGVHTLHTSGLPYSYYSYAHTGRHLGGLDLKGELLCWSALTEIFCAEWHGGAEIDNLQLVLPAYRAAQSACIIGGDGSSELGNITTGIAIDDVDPDEGKISLYFGCQQQGNTWGGAGYLKLYPDMEPMVFRVTQSSSPIHAGAMFLAEPCGPNHASMMTASVYSALTALLTLLITAALHI